ncbi:PTS sugar transporter subunit IIB [Sporosarcina beigongshangi]|uniref:PTS sugar transporter subunit IIB n=1 Tax=Sporosarcina beigongshangi TaxID=2782538 RepID=UPI00193A5F82|nr:PTS sugar transporter subunit IIB [Sporosarcina beigongshangi]
MKYRILVACGTGGVTSTHVATRLKEELARRGIVVTTTQCRIQDIAVNLTGIDLIVTTSKVEKTYEVPLFKGIPFLTGIGADQLLTEIVKALENKKEIKGETN